MGGSGFNRHSAGKWVRFQPALTHLGSLGHAYWRGALRVAQRHGPLRGEGMGELGGRLPTEPRVRVFGIVILAPGGQRSASMLQGREQGLAQQLVAQSIIAALNKGILGRLSVTIRRVPRLFDLHAVLGAMFCCFFQFQGSNS